MPGKIRVFFLVFAGLACAAAAQAQAQGLGVEEAAPVSLADIDAKGLELAGLIGRRFSAPSASGEKPARLRVGEFPISGTPSPLGRLWTENLISALGNLENRNFTLILERAASSADFVDFILAGELIEAGQIVRIVTRLSKTQGHELIASWNADFQKGPFLRELLAGVAASPQSGRSAPGVRPDIYETDSREAPEPFRLGSDWVSRTFHSADDEDWFAITVDMPGILVLETSGRRDTLVKLYTSGLSSAVDEDDDSGEGMNARLEHYAAAGESYILSVRDYDRETGEYRFRAFLQDGPEGILDTKSNNTREEAIDLDFAAGRLYSLFDSSTDNDWYRFAIPEGGGRLVLHTAGNKDTLLALYDADGKEIAKDDDSAGPGYNASLNVEVPAGPVYLCVSEYDNATGMYILYFSLERQ